ncbi:MAG: phenylalanine--tRNA ligase subunit beta [Terriglobia bacterium]
MKVSCNWLKEFVDIPADPRELKTILTMVGLSVESAFEIGNDWILDLEVTTNRPDCLSHCGVAREIATAIRKPLKRLETVLYESGAATPSEVSIEIRNPELCSRYCGRVIRDIHVRPSPEWMARRLEAVGIRPINNVADVTNYVLMELGHPLHAFDLARLRQRKILVREARTGETLKTLDGVDRVLTSENLVIADAERPVALAGVMGGEDSAIGAVTDSVLLESAWFDPLSIRRTAKAQLLHTEASHRFERGADIEMAPRALDRAAELIAQLAGGEILRGMVDIYPQPLRREKINLRRVEIRRILGAEIPWEDVERILRSLGFAVDRHGTEGWGVMPPSFRLDTTREVDLIEEVARHFGYDRLPARLVPAPLRTERDMLREKELLLSQILISLGFREIITSPMIDPEENAQFSSAQPVVLENPLSQEASALRASMIPSMLAALRRNLDHGLEELRFFEMGKIYIGQNGKPAEYRVLTLGLTGDRRAASIHDDRKALDFFDLKGDLETLLAGFGEFNFSAGAGGAYESGVEGQYFSGELSLVKFGKLARTISQRYKLRRPVWLAELDLERLLELPLRSKSFHNFPKFPFVERDFSLMVPSQMPYGQISEAIERIKLQEILNFRPVELFRGAPLAKEHYSLLLRVTFQSYDHTLGGEEIAALSGKILEALTPLNIHLRSF